MRRRRLYLVIGLAIGACAVIYLACEVIERRRANMVSEERLRLRELGHSLAMEAVLVEPPLSGFPRGDITDLCQWVETRPQVARVWHGFGWQPGEDTLLDIWGRPMVYRFPASDRERIFDLYSVGPNGVDDMGDGDDVTADSAEFESYAFLFRDGVIDVDWVRAHLDELKWDHEGKIIGAPPERLERSGEDAPADTTPQP